MTPSTSWIQGLAKTELDCDFELAAIDASPYVAWARRPSAGRHELP
jgi:hypothetical protein